MVELAKPSQTAAVLKKHGFRLSRDLGQNFLIDPNVLKKIVGAAEIDLGDQVLEIGAGIGTLTLALANKAASVTAVELDKRLMPILAETLAGRQNISIMRMDAMDLTAEVMPGRPDKLVANLPYGIAAPVILKILKEFSSISTLVVMVQKEIAERIMAGPGEKNYSGFTVKLSYLARAKLIMPVSRYVFMPQPNVDSAVIKLTRREEPPENAELTRLFAVVTAAFSQRRKTLLKAVSTSSLQISKGKLEAALESTGLDARVRAEELTPAEFRNVVKELANQNAI